jgi:vancomycin resistance protein VanJ
MSEAASSQWQRRCGSVVLVLSAILSGLTTLFFLTAWDQVAAITTFPQWSWALIGTLAAMIGWRLMGRRARFPPLLLVGWLLTTLLFADNLVSVVRGLAHGSAPSSSAPSGSLRIVTLNCASSPLAAAETMKFNPEVVLLQESPASNEVARLAREWFGEKASFVVGLDCTIVSRHTLRALEQRPSPRYTQAILLLSGDREILVTSLRLNPPLGKSDLWNPATWRAYVKDRQVRKRQLQAVLERPSTKPEFPEIMAGDFNAPAGDGIYKLLIGFRDAHRRAGRGWGNTALNSLPFFRPDQIWLKRLFPVSCYAVRTTNSDHRMVVADLLLDSK